MTPAHVRHSSIIYHNSTRSAFLLGFMRWKRFIKITKTCITFFLQARWLSIFTCTSVMVHPRRLWRTSQSFSNALPPSTLLNCLHNPTTILRFLSQNCKVRIWSFIMIDAFSLPSSSPSILYPSSLIFQSLSYLSC